MKERRRKKILYQIDIQGVQSGAAVIAHKVYTMPTAYWAIGGAIGFVELVVGDRFFWLWVLLAFANLVDWIAGRWAVRATEPEKFDRRISRIGIYSKALGLIIVAILRTLEAVLPIALGVPSTRGYIAAVVTVALVIDELDSIDAHRQRLGKSPVPMLSWAIARLRKMTGGTERDAEGPKVLNDRTSGD